MLVVHLALVQVRLGTVPIAFCCGKMLSRSIGHSKETRPRPMAWPSRGWMGAVTPTEDAAVLQESAALSPWNIAISVYLISETEQYLFQSVWFTSSELTWFSVFFSNPAIGADGLCCQSREVKEWHGCRATKGLTKGIKQHLCSYKLLGRCVSTWTFFKVALKWGSEKIFNVAKRSTSLHLEHIKCNSETVEKCYCSAAK